MSTATKTVTKEIPKDWRELAPGTVIGTDDMIWQWDTGPWAYVDGSLIGERYMRPCITHDRHWTIIREVRLDGTESWPRGNRR